MNLHRTTLAGIGCLFAIATASAANLQDAIDAIQKKDYPTAIALLKPMAEQGEPKSMTLLAIQYEFGRGVPADAAQAQALFQKAADKGYVLAQYQLGNMYRDGVVSHDPAQAAHWYSLAATQGYAVAQTNLGALYQKGNGVPLDLAQSVALFRKGAAGGDAVGYFDLAVVYANGAGVPRDLVAADALLEMAVAQYVTNAKDLAGGSTYTLAESLQRTDTSNQKNALAARDKIAAMLSPAQAEQARALVQQMTGEGVT
ncbi:MAG TPA: tetratricopeptide repeat protein [Xanthomonadaceae bacterium]|jgi:TPR repeat protein|nr:tetratricopeptide repeat protein [Xanthomonadaceae bacterium]